MSRGGRRPSKENSDMHRKRESPRPNNKRGTCLVRALYEEGVIVSVCIYTNGCTLI